MNLSDLAEQALAALRYADTHLVSTVGWYGLSPSGTAHSPGPDGARRAEVCSTTVAAHGACTGYGCRGCIFYPE